MARDLLRVPVKRMRGGIEIPDVHKEYNPENKKKILEALHRAPPGYVFWLHDLKNLLEGRFQPPVRPDAKDAKLPLGKLNKGIPTNVLEVSFAPA